MTLDEFLEEFKEIAPLYTWRLSDEGRIRSNCGCPIETFANYKTNKNYEYDLGHAIHALGEPHATEFAEKISTIVCAADNLIETQKVKEVYKLREKLLEITGLK